jgi:hypothetical protein
MQEKVKGAAAEMEFVGNSPDQFQEFIKSEFALWQRVIRSAKIQTQ